jgi:hypothetical protein
MKRYKFLIFMCMVSAVIALFLGIDQRPAQAVTLIPGTDGYYIPDYFTTPNWANSPPLRNSSTNCRVWTCGRKQPRAVYPCCCSGTLGE